MPVNKKPATRVRGRPASSLKPPASEVFGTNSEQLRARVKAAEVRGTPAEKLRPKRLLKRNPIHPSHRREMYNKIVQEGEKRAAAIRTARTPRLSTGAVAEASEGAGRLRRAAQAAGRLGKVAGKALRLPKVGLSVGARGASALGAALPVLGAAADAAVIAETAYQANEARKGLKHLDTHARGLTKRGMQVQRKKYRPVVDTLGLLLVPKFNPPAGDINKIRIKKVK